MRLRVSDDVILHGQVGWSHYFDRPIDGYAFWRTGVDYNVNNNISLGVAYTDSTLSKSDCALVAESHSSRSCGASVIGRLSFKLYRDDVESAFNRDSNPPQASADPPPLEVLTKKLPRKRSSDDDDYE